MQPKKDQVVTYYPALEEFGQDDAPRAARIVEISKGRGVDPAHGLVTLQISGPAPGRGPYTVRAHVPYSSKQLRGTYDVTQSFEAERGPLLEGAFEDEDGTGAPSIDTAALLAQVNRQGAELAELRTGMASLGELLEAQSSQIAELRKLLERLQPAAPAASKKPAAAAETPAPAAEKGK